MRRSRLPILVLPSLLAACAAGEQALSVSVVETCLKVRRQQERVFRTAEEWRRFVEENGGSAADAPSVDFGRLMLAARFDGAGSACTGFTVEEAVVRDGSVVVRATRHVSPNPCIAVLAFPQVVVALEQRDLPVSFRIAEARDQVPGQTRACF